MLCGEAPLGPAGDRKSETESAFRERSTLMYTETEADQEVKVTDWLQERKAEGVSSKILKNIDVDLARCQRIIEIIFCLLESKVLSWF